MPLEDRILELVRELLPALLEQDAHLHRERMQLIECASMTEIALALGVDDETAKALCRRSGVEVFKIHGHRLAARITDVNAQILLPRKLTLTPRKKKAVAQ